MTQVLLLATKDTIAYCRRPGQEAVASGARLLKSIPPDLLTAEVTVEDVFGEPSWDISPATMLTLARRARSAILNDGYDGVVITHGVDTLADTAFLTDLLAGAATSRGTIVLTGATRNLDDLSSDGPGNLADAITAAADPGLLGAGVVVCLNGELHAARWVTMVDAAGVAAFSSAPHPPLGRVIGGRVAALVSGPARPPEPRGEPETSVALIKTYPGIDSALLTAATDGGARGVVLEGTGLFNVPTGLLATISDLIEWDIPVVLASRCQTPDIQLTELPPGGCLAAGMGAIGAGDLTPDKARYALMVALGSTGGVDAVRDYFQRL